MMTKHDEDRASFDRAAEALLGEDRAISEDPWDLSFDGGSGGDAGDEQAGGVLPRKEAGGKGRADAGAGDRSRHSDVGTLRPYQSDALEAIYRSAEENQRILCVMPTGAGKTILFAHLTDKQVAKSDRVLILAHRDELVQQAVDKIHRATGLFPQVEKGPIRASKMAKVVVGSIQTMQGRRLEGWPKDHFGWVVVDEAHHATSGSWLATLEHFSEAKVLGVTATPHRTDARHLGKFFEDIAYEIHIVDLIRQGYLCPIRVKSIHLEIDLTKVKSRAGDFSEADLAEAIDPYLESAVDAIIKHAKDRKTLVFLPLIATSKRFAEIAREKGLNAEHVDGQMEDRASMLAWFSSPGPKVMSNASLLLEGYDEPSISCVMMLRPTQSQPLYSQAIGRGTRLFPGKTDLLLLDPMFLSEKHSLIRPANLIARNDAEAEAIGRRIRATSDDEEAGKDICEASDEVRQERERKMVEEIKRAKKRKPKEIGIEELSLVFHDEQVADFEPTMRWHLEPPTPKQRVALTKFGVSLKGVKSKGQAARILDGIFNRMNRKLCSLKQARLLMSFGHPNAENLSFDEARAAIDYYLNRSKKPKR